MKNHSIKRRTQPLSAAGIAWLACACATPTPHVALAPPVEDGPLAPASIPASSFEKLKGLPERSQLEVLAAAARQVLSSPEFRARLARIPAMVTSGSGQATSGRELLNHLLGLTAPGQQPTEYLLGGSTCPKDDHERAVTSLDRSAPDGQPGTLVARTCIQPGILEHATVEEMSCSINTIVHEWTHAIPAEPGGSGAMYSDSGHTFSSGALASFVAGAVAQCVYLEQHGFPMSDAQFEACVNFAGARSFSSEPCEPGWADARFRQSGPWTATAQSPS